MRLPIYTWKVTSTVTVGFVGKSLFKWRPWLLGVIKVYHEGRNAPLRLVGLRVFGASVVLPAEYVLRWRDDIREASTRRPHH